MKVTGYQIREAIKQWELRKDAASRVLDDSLKVFPGEEKPHPSILIGDYLQAEVAIAQLQTLQSRYNLAIKFDFEGKDMSLCEAVKSLGGYSRVEKLWRLASAGGKKDRYYGKEDERDPTKQYAKQVVSPTEGVKLATNAARRASALRAGIATCNAMEKEFDVPTALFE